MSNELHHIGTCLDSRKNKTDGLLNIKVSNENDVANTKL